MACLPSPYGLSTVPPMYGMSTNPYSLPTLPVWCIYLPHPARFLPRMVSLPSLYGLSTFPCIACPPSPYGVSAFPIWHVFLPHLVYVYLHRIACYCTFPLWHGCYLPHMVCLPSLSGLSTFPVWHVSFLYGLSILSLYDVSTISIWRVYLYHPHKACLPSTFGVYTFPIWGVFLFLNGLSTTPHSMSTFFCHTACLLSTFPV